MLSAYMKRKISKTYSICYEVKFESSKKRKEFMKELSDSYKIVKLPAFNFTEDDISIFEVNSVKITVYTNDESDVMIMKLLSPSMSDFKKKEIKKS